MLEKVEIIFIKLKNFEVNIYGALNQNSQMFIDQEIYNFNSVIPYPFTIELTGIGNPEAYISIQVSDQYGEALHEMIISLNAGYYDNNKIIVSEAGFTWVPVLEKHYQFDLLDLSKSSPLLANTTLAQTNYLVNVYYATDRNKDLTHHYGNSRAYDITYGVCKISLPTNRKKGEIPRPHWWKLQFKEDPDRHVIIQQINEKSKADFFEDLKHKIGSASHQDAFVFIHGFNTTFQEAARRTAQMAFDLGFLGAPIMYSWPSRGAVSDYLIDADNIEFAVNGMIAFIRDVKLKTGAQRVHLIGHSMGTRGLTSALLNLRYELDFKFDQLILAAPDIDADVFIKNIAPHITNCAQRVTLYASSNDKAMLMSRKARDNMRRAGESGAQIVIAAGIDTIDASKVSDDFFSSNHDYFAGTSQLIDDMFHLMQHNHAPSDRNLLQKENDLGIYWAFN